MAEPVQIPVPLERDQVIERQGGRVRHPSLGHVPVCWNNDFQRPHQAGRDPEQCGTLPDGFPHLPNVTARKVAKASVDYSQAVCRGGRPEVVLIDHSHRKTPQRRIPCRAGSEDTGADDKEIERSLCKAWEVASHGGESGSRVPAPEGSPVRTRSRKAAVP